VTIVSEETIFTAALEKATKAERAAFLEEACAGDEALRRRVEALLLSHDEFEFLRTPAAERAAIAFDREITDRTAEPAAAPEFDPPPGFLAPPELTGSWIGPYKLLQLIGEGGMGTVWKAQQHEPVKRVVALKLIKAGLDSKQVIARFEAERQALALMDHANIARVLDGGTTNGGRPYFVMDLVKGVPITRYCDEQHLTPRQRLELFIPVCQAVQHAHQKGIIHRDLKPSNVLVALYDGKPVPKIIDFGVAKAAGQSLTEKTLATDFGSIVGTLEYMSPEQAEINQLDIDTRSDIYSLGVLLYELLTGTTPFSRKELEEAGMLEMLRVIREQDPAKPSTKLSTAEGLPTLAANRGTEPAKLTRLVRGELDWIVMKALEKDRNRRYETASGLAEDLQRYLADEPVMACRPSLGYRLRKFLRRNKAPVLAAGLVALALLCGGIGVAFGLIEAWNRRKLTSLWQKAEIARGEAETARDGEAKAKRETEDAREKLAAVEYGRTMQVAHQEWRDNNVPSALILLDSTRPDLRGWEWRYVYRLCHSDLVTFRGHTDGVWSAAISADGTRVATASLDKTARVWEARTGGEVLAFKGHNSFVRTAAFSPDGTRVATGSYDRTARVWDALTGAELLVLKGHLKEVASAAFSPDATRLVTGSFDRTARVWDARSGVVILTLRGHTDSVASAAFDPDGTRVATGSGDGTARIWDARTGTELVTLKGHTGAVTSAAFSPDGTRVVTGSRDRTARVWDANSGAELLALKGHLRDVTAAAFSADGTRVITASYDGTARVWDARAVAEALFLKGHTANVRSAAFSPDGTRVVTASHDGTARVCDARTAAELVTLKGHTGAVTSAAFSPDGTRVVTASSGRGPTLWDARTGAARVWDAKTGVELLALRGHTSHIWSAAFSPDGARVVTGSQDNTARVWDARIGAEILTLKGHTGAVWSAVFSPDGSRLVTGGQDGMAKVWDARTGVELLVLRRHTNAVTSVAFSLDGARLATGSQDNMAKVWDAQTGVEVFNLRGHTNAVTSVAFSPDGSRLVTGGEDGTARIWDVKAGAEVLTLNGHAGLVWSAAFSPDGTRLVTAGRDNTAKVRDGSPAPKSQNTGGGHRTSRP
jgi:WD40 repeat protein/serine/threonine protein kinase